jgi:hypothetical protein
MNEFQHRIPKQERVLPVVEPRHFGHFISVKLTRCVSFGGMAYWQCGQFVESDARTFSMLIFCLCAIKSSNLPVLL